MKNDLSATLAIRELSNGAWTVASIIMLTVCGMYIYNSICRRRRWYRDSATQFAFFMFIFVFGHVIRSADQWISFILYGIGAVDSPYRDWIASVVATGIIIVGKMLCVFMMVPPRWRWIGAGSLIFFSLLVPYLVWIVV